MFRVKELGSKLFVDVETLNEAIEMAIEHADCSKKHMEIRRIKGDRTYFLLGITPYKKNRFVG